MIAEKHRENYISIEDSTLLYGVAIIMMIFHHLFCDPHRLGYNYIPLFNNYGIGAMIAIVGKLCVSIFAFISGYALAIKSEKSGGGY